MLGQNALSNEYNSRMTNNNSLNQYKPDNNLTRLKDILDKNVSITDCESCPFQKKYYQNS